MNTCGRVEPAPERERQRDASPGAPPARGRPRSGPGGGGGGRPRRRPRARRRAPRRAPGSRRSATSIGPAPSVRIATNGSAMRVTKRAEDRDRRRAPDPEERAVAPQAGVGVTSWVGGSGSSSGSEVTARGYPGPSSRGRARRGHGVHSRRLGVARTRAPPGRPSAARPGLNHQPGSPSDPCSTASATASARRSRGLTGRGRVSEADVDAAMREVRLALLEADVNFKVVKDFVARVRERAVGAEVLESLTAGQQVVKIVHEELTALLSAGDRTFHLVGQPGRRRARRPAGLGQDDLDRQARPARRQARPPARCWSPRTPTGRPPPTSSRRSASSSASRSTARRSARPTVDIAARRHRGREAAGPRRRHHRHRRPAHDRRRADGRDPRGRRGHQAGRDAPRRRRDDRPGGRRRRPGVRRRRARDRPHPDQDRRRRPRRRGALDRRRHRHRRSSSWAPARRPTRSRCSTRTGSPAGSSAWATS